MACATCALRPTFGRVSRDGTMALAWSMDKVGPITRSVADAALVFEAIKGRDAADGFSREGRVPVTNSFESFELQVHSILNGVHQFSEPRTLHVTSVL